MQKLKEILFRALVKRGYSLRSEKRVWDIAERTFLYLTPELANGYLNLRNHKRYKEIVLNKEIELLRAHVDEILKTIKGKSFNLVNIGCGDGTKAKIFIEGVDGKADVCFCPVNISEYLVNLALEKIKNENFPNVKDYKPVVKGFEELPNVLRLLRKNKCEFNVVLLLDSMLASYEINDYLYHLSEALLPGDFVIIGNGIRKGKRFEHIENYKNPLFNEWFIYLMRELGFDDREVEYDARFEHGRVETYYRIKVDKVIEHEGREIKFRKGDEIIVGILYKYFPEELEEFCDMYFSRVNLIKDKDGEYALILCRK